MAARLSLEQHVDQRMTKRLGVGAECKTKEGDVKMCLVQNIKLPVCYASDLSRLLAVDVSQCDSSTLLNKLRAFCLEERSLTHEYGEIAEIRAALGDMSQSAMAEIRSENISVRDSVPKVLDHSSPNAQADQLGYSIAVSIMQFPIVCKKTPQ